MCHTPLTFAYTTPYIVSKRGIKVKPVKHAGDKYWKQCSPRTHHPARQLVCGAILRETYTALICVLILCDPCSCLCSPSLLRGCTISSNFIHLKTLTL